MKTKIKIFLPLLMAFGLLFSSCEDALIDPADYKDVKDPSLTPEVTADDPVKVSSNYAILTGSTQEGTLDRGFVLSTDEGFSDIIVVSSADSTEDFSVRATSLSQSTQYYYKAFATTLEGGTRFGETVKSFTTREGIVVFSISYDASTLEDWQEAGFSTIDKDGDGEAWALTYYDEDAEQVAFVSYSWYGDPLTPENYLLFPEFDLDGVDGALTITLQAGDPDWYAEAFKVVVSDEPITEDNCRDAEVIFAHTLEDGEMFTATADLPEAYDGGKVYLAIVHSDVTDFYNILLLGAQFSYAQ